MLGSAPGASRRFCVGWSCESDRLVVSERRVKKGFDARFLHENQLRGHTRAGKPFWEHSTANVHATELARDVASERSAIGSARGPPTCISRQRSLFSFLLTNYSTRPAPQLVGRTISFDLPPFVARKEHGRSPLLRSLLAQTTASALLPATTSFNSRPHDSTHSRQSFKTTYQAAGQQAARALTPAPPTKARLTFKRWRCLHLSPRPPLSLCRQQH